MLPLYKKQRAVLFRTIEILNLQSATEDRELIKAFQFILKHKMSRSDKINIQTTGACHTLLRCQTIIVVDVVCRFKLPSQSRYSGLFTITG